MSRLKQALPAPVADLHPKHRRFVLEYHQDYNATAAAKRAGYAKPKESGRDLLGNENIQAGIKAYSEELAGHLHLSGTRILEEVARMAFHDPGSVFESVKDAEGNRTGKVQLRALDEIDTRVIKSIKYSNKGSVCEVKFYDKLDALDLLARSQRMYADSRGTTAPLNVNIDLSGLGPGSAVRATPSSSPPITINSNEESK